MKYTEKLQLFEYEDTVEDGNEKFLIQRALNDNWEKIDKILGDAIDRLRPIGSPVIRLDDTLFDDEVRLEGGKVLKSDYPNLVRIYGDLYAPDNARDTDRYLYLPNFIDRTVIGSTGYGYVEAGLPNIQGIAGCSWTSGLGPNHAYIGTKQITGCFYCIPNGTNGVLYYGLNDNCTSTNDPGMGFDASKANPIYGNSDTVMPPAIRVRVVTRFK